MATPSSTRPAAALLLLGALAAPGAEAVTLVVPIVLDVATGSAHFTTELTLTNRSASAVSLTLRYEASLGEKLGSGAVVSSLLAGEQRVIPDVLDHLRSKGLAIPSPGVSPQQGGVLTVDVAGAAPDAVAVTARTTTATSAPHPAGAAGLAYPGQPAAAAGFAGEATIFGLRATAEDRSNVAVLNPGREAVTVRVVAHAGDGSGASYELASGETIPPLGFVQWNRVFEGNTFTHGWVTVRRTSAGGTFGAYGVVNDNGTSDGSYVAPSSGATSGNRLTVPVLVETPSFRSELVLANRGATEVNLFLQYVESLSPSLGPGGQASLRLKAGEQRIIPEAIAYLRGLGFDIGAAGAGSYAGALRILVSGGSLGDVFAGARTAASSPAPSGGRFGLFTPGIAQGQEAATDAFVYGLRADAANRSNVALLSTGELFQSDTVELEVRVHDGDAAGAERGEPARVTLAPGAWRQLGSAELLTARGVANGWVRISRVSGTSPWAAYGVINDGGAPGERTGDGAYVAMTLGAAAPPPQGEEITYRLPGDVPLTLVRIPAGTFLMGAPPTERGVRAGETRHQVTLTRDYYIGKLEVTREQWQAVMDASPPPCPSGDPGPRHPVACISWPEITGAGGFLEKLNQRLGLTEAGLRLPTEAEWERAARGGSDARFSFGEAPECGDVCEPCSAAADYVWWCGNEGTDSGAGESGPRAVGQKRPSPYGLHDVHGNVAEWVADWYEPFTAAPATDPVGPASGEYRVTRGGGYEVALVNCRSAFRSGIGADSHSRAVGFRLARTR